MSFDKPSDIAIAFGIFAIIIITIGMGVTSVVNQQNVTTDESYFVLVNSQINDSNGFTAVGQDTQDAINLQTGVSDESTSDNILVRGWNAIKNLNTIVELTTTALNDGLSRLGINPLIMVIIGTILIIVFITITYSWFRGRA